MDNFAISQILVALLLIFLTSIIYQKIIKPFKIYQFYKKVLTDNYQTDVGLFTIAGYAQTSRYRASQAKFKDSHYFVKRQIPNYQIRLNKVSSQIYLEFVDPELIRQFYQKEKEGYYQKSSSYPVNNCAKILIGNGLLMSEHEDWYKKKKILSKLFNFEFFQSKMQIMAQICQTCFDQMQNQAKGQSKNICQVKIIEYFQKVFGKIILKFFFGEVGVDKKIGGKQFFAYVCQTFKLNVQRSRTAYAFALGPIFSKLNLRPSDRQVKIRINELRKYIETVIQTVQDQIEQQKKQSEPSKEGLNEKGLIWWIIKHGFYSENQTINHEKYTKEQLIDQVITFFTSGTLTTSDTVASIIYILSKNPPILQKLKSQIDTVFGQKSLTLITTQNIKQFHYLQNVLKQVLRTNEPLPNLLRRVVSKDHFLGKIPMKKGIQVSVNSLANHYKHQFYQNPLEFNPDRWDTIDLKKVQQFSYFPFSFGKRVCIGQLLAVLESKIALIGLLRRIKSIKLQKQNYNVFQMETYGPQHLTVFFTIN